MVDLRDEDSLGEGGFSGGQCRRLLHLPPEVAEAATVQLSYGGEDRDGVLVVGPGQQVRQPGPQQNDPLGQLSVTRYEALQHDPAQTVPSEEDIGGIEAHLVGHVAAAAQLASDLERVGHLASPLGGGGHPERPGVAGLHRLHQGDVVLPGDGGAGHEYQTWGAAFSSV